MLRSPHDSCPTSVASGPSVLLLNYPSFSIRLPTFFHSSQKPRQLVSTCLSSSDSINSPPTNSLLPPPSPSFETVPSEEKPRCSPCPVSVLRNTPESRDHCSSCSSDSNIISSSLLLHWTAVYPSRHSNPLLRSESLPFAVSRLEPLSHSGIVLFDSVPSLHQPHNTG
ncbi:uncharacterized protein BDV17DRAFT_209699 [Aspergillus undulatus]|uniref:uncharacterized protein n=1 Tax=Aspergillus undulatus TaxID=1810928 RepID=UPI003CCD506F